MLFFGISMLNQLGSTNFSDNDNFQNYLPGIVIVPDTSTFGGGIADVSLFASASNISLYYQSSTDTIVSEFPLTISGFNVGSYRHNYQGTEIATTLASNTVGEEFSYTQGLAGLGTLVEFPNIENYGDVVILKAELQITQFFDASNEIFVEPNRIFALEVTDSTNQSLTDFSFFGSNHFDGFATDITIGNDNVAQYTINISDYLQDVLLGEKENNGLFITNNIAQTFAGGSANTSLYFGSRIKLYGSNHQSDDYRLKLLLKYSRP